MHLKEWMNQNKMSVRALSTETHYHENHIRMILRGERQPGMNFCHTIENLTNGEVKTEEMRWPKKERKKCPKCGKMGSK